VGGRTRRARQALENKEPLCGTRYYGLPDRSKSAPLRQVGRHAVGGARPQQYSLGTDTPVIGPPPQWQIEAFQAFTIPEDVREHYGYPPLDADIKRKILDGNAARLFGLDIEQTRKPTEADLLC